MKLIILYLHNFLPMNSCKIWWIQEHFAIYFGRINSGCLKTYHRAKKEFFWDDLKYDIQKFVAECLVCQQNKVETIKTPWLLQPLSIPSQHWEDISMDFITSLPKSEGKSVIMVVVDILAKYTHCIISSI